MGKEVYLDNAATTWMLADVKKAMSMDFGNPSAIHKMGIDADNAMYESKCKIAKSLDVKPDEIYFTSGGTEGNNIAIIGGMREQYKNKGRKMILYSSIEHACVKNSTQYMSKENLQIRTETILVDKTGRIDFGEFKKQLIKYHSDIGIVSIMAVNNEIGTIQDIEALGKIIKECDPHILFHVDAVQAYGKIELLPQKWGVDLLTVSGHKIHGPKGSGFIYINQEANIQPIIYGGGQQNGIRPGTENMNGIVGLGIAAENAHKNLNYNFNKTLELYDYFVNEIKEIPGTTINGSDIHFSPYIVSVTFHGLNGERILQELSYKGVYVSTGSACSNNGIYHPSDTLVAIGLKDNDIKSTIRFSFSSMTTKEEIVEAIRIISKTIKTLIEFNV